MKTGPDFTPPKTLAEQVLRLFTLVDPAAFGLSSLRITWDRNLGLGPGLALVAEMETLLRDLPEQARRELAFAETEEEGK